MTKYSEYYSHIIDDFPVKCYPNWVRSTLRLAWAVTIPKANFSDIDI